MSLYLGAPYELPQTTIKLPNPKLDDSDAVDMKLNVKQAWDGTRYSYVKTNDQRLLSYSFSIPRAKMLEVEAFITQYFGEWIRLDNHKDEVWRCMINTDIPSYTNVSINEWAEFTLVLRGQRIA